MVTDQDNTDVVIGTGAGAGASTGIGIGIGIGIGVVAATQAFVAATYTGAVITGAGAGAK